MLRIAFKRLEKQIMKLDNEPDKEKALTTLNEMLDLCKQITEGLFSDMFANIDKQRAKKLSKLAQEMKSKILAKGE